jgi:redox-sensitive bicupin YhaK (pirin superfamily)
MTAPRYQDIAGDDVPEIIDDDGTRVKVIILRVTRKPNLMA